MSRLFTSILAILMAVTGMGQLPVQTGPQLVAGSFDVIGMDGWPSSPPLIIESGPGSFYWIGASSYYNVEHPLLGEVVNDFANIYFLNYNEKGEPTYSNVIRGTSYPMNAFSYAGGLLVAGGANRDVEANGNVIPINNANWLEFIAKYNDRCQFEKIINIWEMEPSQYPNSGAQMDMRDGSVYISGTYYAPLNVAGFGVIGQEGGEYFYVLKFDRNLDLRGVFTAGFDQSTGEYGVYRNIIVSPDVSGNVLVTGSFETDRAPVIGGDVLKIPEEGFGLFALKLDRDLKKVWTQEGSMKGWNYETQIYKGIPMQNGDLILTGVTATGYFQLGEAEFTFPGGIDYTNQFAFRLAPDGTVRWTRPLSSYGPYSGEKKSAPKDPGDRRREESDQFRATIYWDAIQWNQQVLYMTGSFLSDSFEVAGLKLEKKFSQGLFVAAVDLATGQEQWGYGLSSYYTCLFGFDLDAGGNVSLMGCTGNIQDFPGIGMDSVVLGPDLIFHLGLDYEGKPLWKNNAYLQNLSYGAYGADLEVLRDGAVFSSIYKSDPSPLLIGGGSITSTYPYTSILVKLDAANQLGGTVTDEQGSPVFPGSVKAFKSTLTGAFPAVDSALLDVAGYYLIEGLYPGSYTLQVLPDGIQYPDGMPTYLGDAVSWNEAQFIDVKTDTKATFMDIILTEVPKLVTGDGNGKMSGNVSYEEEVVFKGTQAKPVTRTSVILIKKATAKGTQEDNVVAYVETDDLGNYIFENVPDGEYILIVDIPGLPMIQTYEVTIEGNKIVSGLDFTVGTQGINTSDNVGVPTVGTNRFMLFPNPGNGLFHIVLPDKGDYQLHIFNSVGGLVESLEFPATAGNVVVDLSGLQTGIYVLKIEGAQSGILKYIKE